jgi:hypothetical protein
MRKAGASEEPGRRKAKTQPQFDPESQPDEELSESNEELELVPLSKDEVLLADASNDEWLGLVAGE